MDLISNQQILMRLFLFSKRFLTLSYPNLMRSATHVLKASAKSKFKSRGAGRNGRLAGNKRIKAASAMKSETALQD